MKLLITGGLGFIGSSVVRLAVSRGLKVLNIDAMTYAATEASVSDVSGSSNYTFKRVNLLDNDRLLGVLNEFRPDVIMHLAAETHVDRSISGPHKFIETNILGTYNLLEATRTYLESGNAPNEFKFHHISTDEVYGSLPLNSAEKFTELSSYAPRSPYSASKASSDHLVKAWSATYHLPTIISNCSNNYGPYQFPEKLIPVSILGAIRGQEIKIYGNGENVRDWLFVEDHAEALLLIARAGKIGEKYNVGGDDELPNIELIEKLCEVLNQIRPKSSGSYADQIVFVKDRPGHDLRYAVDSTHIKDSLSWNKKVSIDDGLKRTVHWFLNNESWWKPLVVT